MRLRTRLVAQGSAAFLAAAVCLSAVLLWFQRQSHLAEMELRARIFLDTVAVQATVDLASSQIERMDQLAANLADQGVLAWDVRFVAILDSDRRVVAHTHQSAYGTLASDPFSVDAAAAGRALVQVQAIHGERVLLASRPLVSAVETLPGIRWGTLIVGLGLKRGEEELLWLIAGTLGFIVTILTAVASASLVLLDRSVAQPIRRVTEAAQAFAAGDLDARAPTPRGRDEIASLASTFNDMAGRLQGQTRLLEAEIQARTRELQTLNRELSEANTRLEDLVRTDGLTGLFNRRHFNATLEDEVLRAQRQDTPLSLLMIDLDHFKQFNDTHGHPAGDEALREVARLLRARLRRTDVPCRYGGEELAAVLLATTLEGAMAVAEEVRAQLAERRFLDREGNPTVIMTASIGVATFPAHGAGPAALVSAADAALYRAKELGRNRVEVARNDPA